MENEKQDWFSEGWSDDGGVVADGRQDEEMPEERPEDAEEGKREEPDPSREGIAVTPAGDLAPDRKADFLAFIREYPGVEARDIPAEVWRRAAKGESLVTAYARYEAGRLREENRRLRQSEENRRRSAGSQRGAGAGDSRRDAFESGWDDAY